ncbi:MAG TPA: tetratricopeptide repeat protein [Verrucomicrobiae bacterium]|jgi:tetratricopeptide (TPR) repeat protein|nr:tetratricopeptide repeat protein [Verrucomicrobiae bacterium]
MDNDVARTAEFYQLVKWYHANRQRVISVSVGVLVIGAAIGGFISHKQYVESQAAEAFSNVKLPPTAQAAANPSASDALPYIKVADDYSGTRSAARALLIAGSIQFDAGQFDAAQKTFQRFMSDYSASPLANQALLGIASSLEAQGKVDAAAAAYDDLIKRHLADSTTPQAKSALARLYVAQGKPEQAMHLYEELARANNNDTWSAEAGIQLQELLAKYPNLTKPAAAPKPSATPLPLK